MPKKEEKQEKTVKLVGDNSSKKSVKNVSKKSVNSTNKDNKKVSKITKEKKTTTTEKSKSKTKNVKKEEKVSEEIKKVEVQEEQVDEATVIEKIKSFIAKIAAMQEETKREMTESKDEKVTSKEKTKQEKQNKKVEVKKIEYLPEYYDLPYRYNETIVKILAQTPNKMFVYWDISDSDKEKYINAFGDDFFYKTYPVLLLYNEDKKYVKEIQINDFANSWYIEIDEPKTKYTIQLGRKFKENTLSSINMQKVEENNIILYTDYLPFANSNVLEIPNNRVLLDKLPRFIKFRNVKTNEEITKDLRTFKDIFGKTYDVKEFYEEHYKDEISEGMFDMANPSSNLSSSSFK